MSEQREECGIAAIYYLPKDKCNKISSLLPADNPNTVSHLIPRMLLDLQNRGQSAAGVSSYSPNREQVLMTHKDLGLVAEVFFSSQMSRHTRLMQELEGPAAIGHVRYVTQGENRACDAQPQERYHFRRSKWFSFAFNGNIANYKTLREKLRRDEDICITGHTDTELIVYEISRLIARQLSDQDKQQTGNVDHLSIARELANRLDGAYCLTYLTAQGELVVARDPNGLKPLCYAFDGEMFAAASESVALFNIGFSQEQIKPVPPGTIIVVTENGLSRENGFVPQPFVEQPNRKHCFFEWVYFANVASKIDSKSVYVARKRLGEELARRENIPIDDDTIVVPVPDTSKAAADGMAYELRIPCLEGLIRNRYSGRTFIEGKEYRQRKAESKYTPLREVLEGKRVFLVEDSIVRSTTMRVLLKRLRTVGHAKEIHVRVACPPIISPCFYGIDMPTFRELFASQFYFDAATPKSVLLQNEIPPTDISLEFLESLEPRMAEMLGADSLHYLPMDAVAKAIGFDVTNFCIGCVSGKYPTESGNSRAGEAFVQSFAHLD
ncbi:MAG: amidophosphoribosyltransferase [Planctomycetaceae bacterium]|jgi:amidophosphoribosyltransferase|nr:amidophosphoribosyltransferase [Planctomycetaceae bacterium]